MALGQRTRAAAAPPSGAATDQRILEHARRAFNERGVGAVGIREIARELGLSPGNVSYHFPTKEALVIALVRAGHAANNAAVSPPAPLGSFADVDRAIRAIMRRDVENRWLLRDYAGLLVTMPALRALHEQMQPAREARLDTVLKSLVHAGLLNRERIKQRGPELRRQIFTQIFFWLPSAVVTAPSRDPASSLDAHARAAMALFLAHCTAAGRRQLDAVLCA